jgi:Uma2 family endonuclease
MPEREHVGGMADFLTLRRMNTILRDSVERGKEVAMATKTITVPLLDDHAEPAWEVALLFPAQGAWSEDDYLWLTDHTRCLVELTDGHIEVLPMPTDAHQRIVLFLYRALYAFLAARGLGIVLVAPLRLRVRTGRYREPDLLLLLSADDPRRSNRYWTGADLVLEVVSPDDPKRDLVRKRREYARAGIPEYWIVNPATAQILVLHLAGTAYVEHGVFTRGTQATSALLEGFTVAVAAVLEAE